MNLLIEPTYIEPKFIRLEITGKLPRPDWKPGQQVTVTFAVRDVSKPYKHNGLAPSGLFGGVVVSGDICKVEAV